MTLDGLTIIVVLGFAWQIGGLMFLGVYLARETREIARIGRAVAAMVYQEEEKTRALIREISGPRRA
ncbi:MAG: hypothetical protein ACREM3_25400 [Candidatus Rokuibacteriota bacterium]